MKILNRYVLREHAGPLLFALTALTSLLLLNYIAKQFGELVGKGLPWTLILEFFFLSVPFTVAMTLPMAVLVSTLYAFSRLASENEITALKASGVSLMRVLTTVLIGASVLAVIMIVFNDQVLPRANHRLRVLQGDIASKKPTFALREQVINEVQPGRLFLRTGHLDEGSNRMREVTIYDLSDQTRRRTIYAQRGDMRLVNDLSDLELVLYDGYMQEVGKEKADELQRLFFTTNTLRVRGIGNKISRSTNDNFKSDREMSVCELHAEHRRAETDRLAAEAMLRGLPRAIVDSATKGEGVPRRARGRGLSVGRLYCEILRPGDGGAAHDAKAGGSASTLPPSAGGTGDAPMSRSIPALTSDTAPPPTAGQTASPVDSAGMTAAALGAYARVIESARTMNLYDVEIQKKFAIAVACVVFVLLGAPIALRFPRGGVGLTIGVSLGVFALYYVGLIAGEALADKSLLPAFVAMWAANILFTIVGVVLVVRMGREGSTARGGDAGEFIDALRAWLAKQLDRFGFHFDRRRRA